MIEKEMEEYGRVKKEYDNFKEIRKNLGLKSFKFINVEQIKKNIGENKLCLKKN